ncbi:alpha/beta fold hydrolase [Rhizorhabdus histidinilytica]
MGAAAARVGRRLHRPRPSHPGFGTSDQPRNLNRVDDLGYFYLDLMDVLGLDRPVIVGSSFGGWVAAEIATKAPERVATLILASPSVCAPPTGASSTSPTSSCCRGRSSTSGSTGRSRRCRACRRTGCAARCATTRR